MVSLQEKAQCVLWYHETKSPVAVQRKFRNEYRRDPPDVKSIKDWYKKFTETGSVQDRKRSGRPSVSDAWREIEFRLDVLRATKGAHVEIYK